MTRNDAYELLIQRLSDGATTAHCLACEACMRALAQKLDGDVELWGLAGLTHDLDLDECANDPGRHGLVAGELLRDRGAPEDVVLAVMGHNDKAPRDTLMAKALWVVDPTTGMITASALIRPSRSTADLDVKSVKKRMKDKRFAAAVNRDQIRACGDQLGMDLDEFLALCLGAMNEIRVRLGLAGA